MHCGQTGAPAVGNFTTNITVIFSGFSAKNADDAKNTGSFMDESSRKFDYVKEILLCLRQKRPLCTLS